MILPLLLAVSLASPTQFDHAGRACFSALRDYERVLRPLGTSPTSWPAPDQLRAIDAALRVAYETVRESLPIAQELQAGHGLPPQVASLLRSDERAIVALATQSTGAPANVQKALRKVQRTFAALFTLFPLVNGEFDAHPAPRLPPPKGVDGRGQTVRGNAIAVPLDKRTPISTICECAHPEPRWHRVTGRVTLAVCNACHYLIDWERRT